MPRCVYYVLAIAAVAYLLLALVLWWQQDQFVFPGAHRGARAVDTPGVAVRSLPGLDGLPFRAVRAGGEAPRAVLAWFVGNGEDLRGAARRAAELAEHGVAVWSCEYPGYGESAGTPGQASLFAAAERLAAEALAEAQQRGVPFLTGGGSLGTFCALHVAAAGTAARCLLFAPPTTLAAAASGRFWWLPVGLLLRHRFDNLAAAPQVRCPVLIVHGDADDIVPIALGEQLRAAFAGPAELLVVPGGGHNDVSFGAHAPAGQRIGEFLRGER